MCAFFVPWASRGPDPVDIAQAAASTVLRNRQQNDAEINSAAQRNIQQQELAARNQQLQISSAGLLNRLKLGYDRLAQTDAERRAALTAKGAQDSAANLLRSQQQDLMSKHYASEDAAKQGKQSAADALRDATNNDIVGFYNDLPTMGLGPALQAHPFAATEPGIRSAASQVLINPKKSTANTYPKTDLTIPGTTTPGANWYSGSTTTDPTTIKGVPLNSPLVNKFGSPSLSAVAGTNYVDSLNGPAPSPLAVGPSAALPPSAAPTVRVKHPNGTTGVIPASQLQDAIDAGYTPLEDAPSN